MDLFNRLYKYKHLLKDIRSTIQSLLLCLTSNVEKRITYLDLLLINLLNSNKVPKEWLMATNTIEVEMNFGEWISNFINNYYELKMIDMYPVEDIHFKTFIFKSTCNSAELIVKYLT